MCYTTSRLTARAALPSMTVRSSPEESQSASAGLVFGGGCTVALRGSCVGGESSLSRVHGEPSAPSGRGSAGDGSHTDSSAVVCVRKVRSFLLQQKKSVDFGAAPALWNKICASLSGFTDRRFSRRSSEVLRTKFRTLPTDTQNYLLQSRL